MIRTGIVFITSVLFILVTCNAINYDFPGNSYEELPVIVKKKRILSFNYLNFPVNSRDNNIFHYNSEIIPKDNETEKLFKSANPLHQKLAKLFLEYKDENVRTVIRTWYAIKAIFYINKNNCTVKLDYDHDYIQFQAEYVVDFN